MKSTEPKKPLFSDTTDMLSRVAADRTASPKLRELSTKALERIQQGLAIVKDPNRSESDRKLAQQQVVKNIEAAATIKDLHSAHKGKTQIVDGAAEVKSGFKQAFSASSPKDDSSITTKLSQMSKDPAASRDVQRTSKDTLDKIQKQAAIFHSTESTQRDKERARDLLKMHISNATKLVKLNERQKGTAKMLKGSAKMEKGEAQMRTSTAKAQAGLSKIKAANKSEPSANRATATVNAPAPQPAAQTNSPRGRSNSLPSTPSPRGLAAWLQKTWTKIKEKISPSKLPEAKPAYPEAPSRAPRTPRLTLKAADAKLERASSTMQKASRLIATLSQTAKQQSPRSMDKPFTPAATNRGTNQQKASSKGIG